MAPMAEKITYASLNLTEEDHRAYEAELGFVDRNILGVFPAEYKASRVVNFSPSDNLKVTSVTQEPNEKEINGAVKRACDATARIENLGWERRAEILRRAKELVLQKKFTVAALLTHEAGKNRAEALAEVNEVAAMIDAYVGFAQENNWYAYKLSPNTYTRQRSLGGPVAVIAPFNFPFALMANMSMAAFLAGNPVVLKPSEETPLSSLFWKDILVGAGMPEEACQFLMGRGETVGAALNSHPGIRAIAFTGSLATGKLIMNMHASLSKKGIFRADPVMEMGGKNPVIVTARADLDKAAEGILRAVLGYGGQKCSATSRVYAERSIFGALRDRLVDMAQSSFPDGQKVTVDRPGLRETYLGPVINSEAVKRYNKVNSFVFAHTRISAFELCSDPSAKLVEQELKHFGNFVVPLLITGVDHSDWVNKKELFLPVVTLLPYDSLAEAVLKANDTEFGLCAGIFSEDEKEIDYAAQELQSGMVYINRKAGATTGAWPGVQSFGGWKGSGTSGRQSFGKGYVLNFTREQCTTRE